MRKLIFFLSLFISTAVIADSPEAYFMSPAHMIMGNEVNLRFSAGDAGLTDAPLHLPNGLSMTYGDILIMPDFYIVNPIAFGTTEKERKQRFNDAFDKLIKSPDESKKILAITLDEYEKVQTGMDQGKSPETVYQEIGDETDRLYNCVTGGGCAKKGWWMIPGSYPADLNNLITSVIMP